MSSSALSAILGQFETPAASDRELRLALHDWVRDTIRFGFTARFDDVAPADTLRRGIGHCNPQADLLRALWAEAGFTTRLKVVGLDKRVLAGATSPLIWSVLPAYVSHALVEIRIESVWVALDSYLFNHAELAQRQTRLHRDGLACGFGTFAGASVEWDGQTAAYTQAHPDFVAGPALYVDSLAQLRDAPEHANRLLGIPFWRLMQPLRYWPLRPLIEHLLNHHG